MKEKGFVAGIDIGGTNTECGIVDPGGVIIGREKLKTASARSFTDYVNKLASVIKGMTYRYNVSLDGIGIGAPNANFYTGTIHDAVNLPWKGPLCLKDEMENIMGLTVTVTNDANAAAAGEMLYGAGRGMKNFIMFTLGTGVGSGIVIDGRVIHGHTGLAGELGHIIIVRNGRRCGCGRRGCLETYCSARGLVTTAVTLLKKPDCKSSLTNVAKEKLNSHTIAIHAEKGDLTALKAFDYTAGMLALGITNSVLFSSPEAIILSGGLARAGNLLLDPLKRYIDRFILPSFSDTFRLIPTELPESDAAILGAAAITTGRFYSE